MKIKNLKRLEDGMASEAAESFWNDIEGFAAYSFNSSHAYSYTVISYLAAYVKANYPVQFYAAALSVADTDEKILPLVKDAKLNGVKVFPPDINDSDFTKFKIKEHDGELVLLTPLEKIQGLSEKGLQSIKDAKSLCGGRFKSVEELIDNVNRRCVNKRVIERLDSIGAFYSIQKGVPEPLDESRLKAQIEALGALIDEVVKAERALTLDADTKDELLTELLNARDSKIDEFDTEFFVKPAIGANAKFMVVTGSATWSEEEAGRFMEGITADPVEQAMACSGLDKNDGYWTGLIKYKRPKEQKTLTNDQINDQAPTLDKEIELLNPAVIVCLGGAAIRHVWPDAKGSWDQLCGQVIYDEKKDRSIVFGMNPSMIAFRPDEQSRLDDVFATVMDMVRGLKGK